MPSVNVYYPNHKKSIIKQAKDLLDREGSSISELCLASLEQFVELHKGGNPQQFLPRFFEPDAQPFIAVGLCSFKYCKALATGTAIFNPDDPHSQEFRLCNKHLDEVSENPKWKVTGRELGK